MVKKVAPLWAVAPVLAACFGEWLAGKPGAKDLVSRDAFRGNVAQIAFRLNAEVLLVQALASGIDLAGENAPMPETGKSSMQTAKAGTSISGTHARITILAGLSRGRP